jgi:16S rRNA (guanine527-N7)-methyltransferase
MSSRELTARIRKRAKRAGAELTPALMAGLEQYFDLLSKWNSKINLTSFSLDPPVPDEAIDRLLIEPVVAAGHVQPTARVAIDVGSGGGSPALPLLLALPHLEMRLVESKTRKAVFLREALRELNLARATVETSRFEELLTRPELHEGADLVTIRAVRVEPRVLVSLQAFLKPHGHLFLFRGPAGSDLADAIPPLSWLATFPLVDSLRSRLVVLQKNSIGRR